MMILFNGHSLTPATKFQPESLNLQLTERSSTASMTVSDAAPAMAVGDWLKLEDGPGSDIVWRVKSVDEQFEKKTRTINLEHIINTLRDKVIFGEVKSEYISGQEGVNPTNEDTARFILEQFQRDWVLGSVAGGHVRNAYTFNGDDLFSALETVSNTIEDCFWKMDMSRYPFRIDLYHLTGEVSSEMRMDRNIRSLKKTVDRNGMYTMLFPIGKDDLHIVGDSISMNTDLYGIVCKVETDTNKETEEDLNRWAHDLLRRHCEPTVTITISGLDLSKATGEQLDSFHIGYMCRVPLPEFGTTIKERITKLSYPDVIQDPMNVTVTLANNLEDVASIINSLASSVAGGARSGATSASKDHAWMEDTEDHVALVAEGIIGTDENGEPNWTRLSQIVVDGQGIHQTVEEIKAGDVIRDAKIDINERRILQEVTDRTNADGELSGRIVIEANRITQEVTDRTNADSTLSGRITVEAGRINQIVSAVGADGEVTAASITLAINEGRSGAWIDADNVWIGNDKSTTVIAGKLNVSDLAAQIARITLLNTLAISADGNIQSTGGIVGASLAINQSYGITNSGTGTFAKIALNGNTSFNDCLVSATVGSNDTVTLTYASGDTVNFNTAASAGFASETLWSNGDKTITLTNGKTKTVSIPDPTSWSGAYIGIQQDDPKMSVTAQIGGKAFNGTISASGAYTAGQNSITDFSLWDGSTDVTGDTVTISPDTSVSLQLYHKKSGAWVAGSTTVVRAPMPASATWSSYWPASNVISVTCQVAGKSYTQSFTRP